MRRTQVAALAAAFVLVAAVVVVAVMTGRPQDGVTPAASPTKAPAAAAITSTPSPTPTLSPTASPSPSASALPAGTFENAVLGYRITLPQGYRRDRQLIFHGRDSLGVDLYTLQTEQEAREECLSDGGDGPPPLSRQSDLRVAAYRNDARNLTAFEWATMPQAPGAQPLSTHHKVERMMVNGLEAVRLVTDNASAETTTFVIRLIRGRDLIYEVGLQGSPAGAPRTSLDEIIKTFGVIPPAPFPSPTATTPPLQAAQDLRDRLAAAFAAKDAAAVARDMPQCRLVVYPLINGEPPGGFQARSVVLFTQGLRERFAAGDLTVTVNTTLEPDPREEGAWLARSEWKEPDRTTRVDLQLGEREGRWQWVTAIHHADWPCRSPWVSTPSC